MSSTASAVPLSTAEDAFSWWRGSTIYQIYPRSFQDSNGDGVGDLTGIIERLDHIASLGVDGIWVSPFFTSPMADFGYDISNFRNVDPVFGTLNDFDRLIEKAHGLGLKVIIDQVYSHSSDQHSWFQESREDKSNPKSDWYVWADAKADGSPPNNWQSVFGGPSWEWGNRRGQYYLHNFLKEQPDLNLHNKDVQNAVLDASRFWLDRGVDGFRLDALNFGMHDLKLRNNPPAEVFKRKPTRPFDFQEHKYNMSQPEILGFVERIRKMLSEYPDRFSVAEVGGPFPLDEMKAFTHGNQRLNSAYSFEFLYASELTADLIKKTLSDWPGTIGEGWPSWAFSNHDAPRALSRWRGDCPSDRYAKLLALLFMSLRGSLIVYQGEELGLEQAEIAFEHLQDPEAIANWPETLGRDGARTPMPWRGEDSYAGFSKVKPWLPITAQHRNNNVSVQNDDPNSVLNFYRRAISLRQNQDILKYGELEFPEADPKLLVIKRAYEGREIVTVLNLTTGSLPFPEKFPSVEKISLQVGDGAKNGELPAYSGFICEV